jgi:hypothetical protein
MGVSSKRTNHHNSQGVLITTPECYLPQCSGFNRDDLGLATGAGPAGSGSGGGPGQGATGGTQPQSLKRDGFQIRHVTCHGI